MTYDGEERRADYMDNGVSEEKGEIVKRVTLTTLYRKMKAIEHNQNHICEKLNEIAPKIEEVNGHKEMLEEHIEFCKQRREHMTNAESLTEAYERGGREINEEEQERAEKQMKQSLYFWAKVLIPATALLLTALYYLADRLIF